MTEGTVFYEKTLREKVKRIFGSEENYEIFVSLNKSEHFRYPEPPWQRSVAGVRFEFEEDYLEKHGEEAPFWMQSPFFLKLLPVASLGIAGAFIEEIENQSKRKYEIDNGDWELTRERWRLDRLPRRDGTENTAKWRDYSSLGWSVSDGDPYRLTSPEEHIEITRRLKKAGLEKAGSKMPVQGWTLAQLMAMELDEPEWIIKDLLRDGGAVMIHGPSGVGKTMLTATLILLMAAGNGATLRDADGSVLLEAGNHKEKKICLVDGEMVAADIVKRLEFLAEGMNIRLITGGVNTAPIEPDSFREAMTEQAIIEKAIAQANLDLNHEMGWDAEGLMAAEAHIQSNWDKREETPESDTKDGADGLVVNADNIVIYPKTAQDYRASFVSLIDSMDKAQIVEHAKREKIDIFVWDNLSTLCENLSDENSAAAFEP